MFILHLFSNWKWTGPAEHALNLCHLLKSRGHRVVFACGRPPSADLDNIKARAEALGVDTLELRLRKHLNVLDNSADAWAISRYIKAERPDIIHSHMANDNLVAGVSARLAGAGVPLVRTSYDGDGMKATLRNRTVMSHLTTGLVVVSERARVADTENFHLRPERVWKVEVGVDTKRFSPPPLEKRLNARKAMGIGPEEVVVGVVARIQWHRRFDVFLDAFKRASERMPELRAVLVGRGTNRVPVAMEPARKMGLDGKIIFPGYLHADRYVDALGCMDLKVFLVPGTDGSCRAVRESMAMGLPIIAARRGMLPEIVEHEKNGLVVDDTPENLAEAIEALASDESLRRRMAEASRRIAVERFSLDKEAQEVEAVYEALLA